MYSYNAQLFHYIQELVHVYYANWAFVVDHVQIIFSPSEDSPALDCYRMQRGYSTIPGRERADVNVKAVYPSFGGQMGGLSEPPPCLWDRGGPCSNLFLPIR